MGKGAKLTVSARPKKPRVVGFRKCAAGLLRTHRWRLVDSARAKEDPATKIREERNELVGK